VKEGSIFERRVTMKRIIMMVPTLAIALLINAAPSLSDEGTSMGGHGNIADGKDECILVALNCPDAVDTLQQRIDKLQSEINKGTAVYSTEELRILNDKLMDARENERDLVERY
jgi:hypothetical protein